MLCRYTNRDNNIRKVLDWIQREIFRWQQEHFYLVSQVMARYLFLKRIITSYSR